YGEVVEPGERVPDPLPPRLRGIARVVDHDHLPAAGTGPADAALVRLAQVDPALDVAGVIALPKVWILDGAEAAAELQALVREQGERDQAHHQPRRGFGRMLRKRERMAGVIVPVHVADLELDPVDGRV